MRLIPYFLLAVAIVIYGKSSASDLQTNYYKAIKGSLLQNCTIQKLITSGVLSCALQCSRRSTVCSKFATRAVGRSQNECLLQVGGGAADLLLPTEWTLYESTSQAPKALNKGMLLFLCNFSFYISIFITTILLKYCWTYSHYL